MDSHDAQEILEKIVELAALLGWTAVLAQTGQGDILGMSIGSRSWLKMKNGEQDPLKPSH